MRLIKFTCDLPPFMALSKVHFIIVQYGRKLEMPENFQ
jgi:hypothetical protein